MSLLESMEAAASGQKKVSWPGLADVEVFFAEHQVCLKSISSVRQFVSSSCQIESHEK
jgi:hypothetical protein